MSVHVLMSTFACIDDVLPWELLIVAKQDHDHHDYYLPVSCNVECVLGRRWLACRSSWELPQKLLDVQAVVSAKGKAGVSQPHLFPLFSHLLFSSFLRWSHLGISFAKHPWKSAHYNILYLIVGILHHSIHYGKQHLSHTWWLYSRMDLCLAPRNGRCERDARRDTWRLTYAT